LEKVLHWLARKTIWKFQPGIVGVTGSVGKTSTKDAIVVMLGSSKKIRMNPGNFNTEIGLALSILGDWKKEDINLFSRNNAPQSKRFQKVLFVLKVIFFSSIRLVFGRKASFPELLVLEYGADKPGDIKKLLQVAVPHIGVVTAVGQVPAHVEFYSSPEAVASEKGRLIEQLPVSGFAILNADDKVVLDLQRKTRATVMTFGFSDDAKMRITKFEYRSENDIPLGISFKLEHGGNIVPVRIHGCFGRSQAYAAAAAACIGISFGLNLVQISEMLGSYSSPKHRMKLVKGVKGANIVDDSYNASPLSMESAFEAIKALPATRRIAVLGDMLELGKYAVEVHESLGPKVSKVFDYLITVGPRAKFIADSANAAKMAKKRIMSFENTEEAATALQDLINPGDLILIKASRALHFERIVGEIEDIIHS